MTCKQHAYRAPSHQIFALQSTLITTWSTSPSPFTHCLSPLQGHVMVQEEGGGGGVTHLDSQGGDDALGVHQGGVAQVVQPVACTCCSSFAQLAHRSIRNWTGAREQTILPARLSHILHKRRIPHFEMGQWRPIASKTSTSLNLNPLIRSPVVRIGSSRPDSHVQIEKPKTHQRRSGLQP